MAEEDAIKHPALARMSRMRPDGAIKPLSIEGQWKQVADWHAFYAAGKASEFPVLDGLGCTWKLVESEQTFNGEPCIERGADMERVARSPLAALFYMVDMGFYPPPELLLTLLDCWDSYMGSGGRMSLDEAFLGRPVQKSGNYAKQSSARFARFMRRMEYQKLIGAGKSPTEAAEAVSELIGGRIEPESILREMRKPRRAGKRNAI